MTSFVTTVAAAHRRLAFVLILLCLTPFAAWAQPPAPPPPSNFFTDHVGVVPAGLAAEIESKLRGLQKESSNQVLVVVADRVPDGYTSLEEYTNRTAEAWRVGDKARDNGAVLFVFVGDRRVRIEVGYGLEGVLPDALASRIINDEITPLFREGRYGQGIMAGVDAIILATKGEYQPKTGSSMRSTDVAFIVFFVIVLLLIGVIFPFWRELQSFRHGDRTYSGTGWSGGRTRRSSGWSSGGGGWSGGGGSSWGGGGGGFSGGGGSFGGGGASGSW